MHEAPILLKPDKLNGQHIFRPVQDGSIKPGVVFPPSVKVALPRPIMIEELVEISLASLVTISDQSPPEVQAQAKLFREKLKNHQQMMLVRTALNERAHMINHLERLGMTDAAKALRDA